MRGRVDVRWWELAPEAVLVLGLGLFAITERSAAASAFGSRKALVLMALTAVGWLGLRAALAVTTRRPGRRLALFAVAALGVLRVVVFPAYDDHTVVEVLTVATTPPPSTTPATASGTEPTVSTLPTAPVPVALRSGAIEGVGHRASGTVVVYRQPTGGFSVGLEDIDIQPGPDYDVFVVPGADRGDVDGATRLDDLRGNKGTQFYDVPAGVDLSAGPWTVLVWCQTFDVAVARATPST